MHHERLEVQDEKPNTKWHNVKDRFRSMFNKEHIDIVERWYNTIAPKKHRDSFREIVKVIYAHEPQKIADPVAAHKAESMMRLYSKVLSGPARVKAQSWVAVATPEQLERFRDIFTAIQTLLQPVSRLKETYTGRTLPDLLPHNHNRRKIDWSSTKTADLVRSAAENPMDTEHVVTEATSPTKRFRKPLKQFDAESVMKSLGITDDQLEELRRQRRDDEQVANYVVDPQTGMSMYRSKTATKAATQSNTKSRVVATFSADTATSWLSTTRDHIRNFGARPTDRVSADKHPAVTRVTASLGMCVPKRQ